MRRFFVLLYVIQSAGIDSKFIRRQLATKPSGIRICISVMDRMQKLPDDEQSDEGLQAFSFACVDAH